MSRVIRTAAFLLCTSLCALSLPVLAQSAENQATAMPEGPGRSLVTAQCTGCHALEVTLGRRETADQWRATVQSMIDRGAAITAPDAAAIASYLGQHYGPTAGTAGVASTAAAQPASALPDGPGKDVLMKKCFQCHQMSMWSTLQQDRRAWEGVIYRMIGRGALWTPDEVTAMAGYLARVKGPVPAAQR
jgi:cytochrome c5